MAGIGSMQKLTCYAVSGSKEKQNTTDIHVLSLMARAKNRATTIIG